jgi:4-amino-4-deoxy-L-arabinose transferase-like glycosyltransferase
MMKNLNKANLIIFCFIILIATVLRLIHLGSTPVSLDWDEASLGYNAYSILQTGKDEYGEFFPLSIKSFGDYKPALYLYFIIPFIPFLGLTETAVRLPSALLGIGAVVVTYFLIKEFFIFGKQKNNTRFKSSIVETYVALIASFLLAISPWHIQFSRVAFEANAALTLNLLGLLFFFLGLRKNHFFPFSVIFLGMGVYMYQSERVFVPLMVFTLLLIFWRTIFTQVSKKTLIVTLVVGFLVVAPFLMSVATDSNTLSRARGVSIFAREYPQTKEAYHYTAFNRLNNEYVGLVFNNARVEYVKIVINNYLSHFNPAWLFLTGDSINRHHAPNMGNLYLWEFPFIVIGIYWIAFSVFTRRIKILLFSWLLIVPIPAAISWDVPSSVRTLNFLPLFQLFASVGILYSGLSLYSISKKVPKLKYITGLYMVTTIGIGAIFFIYYLTQYFLYYNKNSSQDWQYGYKQAIDYLETNKYKYDHIVVSNQSPLDQSYIFFLYHTKYSPTEYQKLSSHNTSEEKSFGKYRFTRLENRTQEGKVLYVGRPQDFSENEKSIYTINYLDGKQAILMIEQ